METNVFLKPFDTEHRTRQKYPLFHFINLPTEVQCIVYTTTLDHPIDSRTLTYEVFRQFKQAT